MRVAIVGAGLAARSHAFDIASNPGLDLVGVCSRRAAGAQALVEEFGGAVYGSVAELLDRSPADAVVVAVPPWATLAVTDECANRDVLVLAEKPVAGDAVGLDMVGAVVERHAQRVIAPFNRRYLTHVQAAAHLVGSGRLGAITRVEARWRGPYEARYGPDAPTYRAHTGARQGLLIDTGSHIIDTLCWLVGAVAAEPDCRMTYNARGADTGFDLRLRAECGATIVASAHDDALETWEITVTGTDGVISFDADHATVHIDGRREEIVGAEDRRPVDDLLHAATGAVVCGGTTIDLVRVSATVVGVYDIVAAGDKARWQRPRFKPWGRLNGSC